MSADTLLVERDGPGGAVAVVTFNRPQVRNALNTETLDALRRVMLELKHDERVRVVILTGAGDKAFVAGTDISQFRGFDKPEHATAYEARMDRVFDALEDVRVPTIAAIQGACTGGGAGIAAACDLRIGAPSAKFGFPIARTLGNTLSTRNFARLAGLIGVARTKDIIFLARLMDADEMRAIGLLNQITLETDLYARADAMAITLMEHAPITLRTAKRALNAVLRGWAPKGDSAHVVEAYMSEDFKEGIEAFLGKRKPRWRGK